MADASQHSCSDSDESEMFPMLNDCTLTQTISPGIPRKNVNTTEKCDLDDDDYDDDTKDPDYEEEDDDDDEDVGTGSEGGGDTPQKSEKCKDSDSGAVSQTSETVQVTNCSINDDGDDEVEEQEEEDGSGGDGGHATPKKTETCQVSNCSTGRWDKKHCCVFCSKYYSKLARHFEQKHADEHDVAYALSLPKKSTKRMTKWQELRNKGDFYHNQTVLKEDKRSYNSL